MMGFPTPLIRKTSTCTTLPATAASNTYAALRWDFATSPTTSPDPSWKPADSNPDYTLDHEEPLKGAHDIAG